MDTQIRRKTAFEVNLAHFAEKARGRINAQAKEIEAAEEAQKQWLLSVPRDERTNTFPQPASK